MKSSERTVQRVAVLTGALLAATAAKAGPTIEFGDGQSISIGGGMRAGFADASTSFLSPATPDSDSTTFALESARLYINGVANETIKWTFNTECQGCVFGEDSGDAGAGGNIDVLDAIVQFELDPKFNVWFGRMLTPADRIEMNGPYYGLSWNQFTVPLLPSDQNGANGAGLLGRDDGVTVWGALGKFQYAAGIFDGVDGGPNDSDNVLFATRLAFNFLNMESNPGYYTSSTYFGSLDDIFTIALSYQSQGDATGTALEPADFSAVILDFLWENLLEGGGVLTIEGEYKTFDAEMTPAAAATCGVYCLFDGNSYFATAAYLFTSEGKMRLQPYIRYTSNEPDTTVPTSSLDTDLAELGLNLIINGHNTRLNFRYTSGDASLSGYPPGGGVDDTDTFAFGVQLQI